MSDETTFPQHIKLVVAVPNKLGQRKLVLSLSYEDATKPGTLAGVARIVPTGVHNPQIVSVPVHGLVHLVGANSETRVFTLEGPEIGIPEAKFTGIFVTDLQWRGYGCYAVGGEWHHNIPVERAPLD